MAFGSLALALRGVVTFMKEGRQEKEGFREGLMSLIRQGCIGQGGEESPKL